ncbi:hypothetical protein BDN72DRAFT_895351 [Pluteus cervinus]|uniref:Uncharacterized protein n=1 Tax=Pluteus cervinus TaxID=181527 RepID=A0ACD3B1N4_9AGAR|nr:hypothetical protein BDN72DRAFT_895351 [Pluteus cervinus]
MSSAPVSDSKASIRKWEGSFKSLFLHGRWVETPTGTIIAGWCGASLQFIIKGATKLQFKFGAATEKKDRSSRGSMFAVLLREVNTDSAIGWTEAFNGEADAFSPEIELEVESEYDVEFMLIDWASLIELEGIWIDQGDISAPPPKSQYDVLFIGDSMPCGFVEDGSDLGLIPHGCLNGYAFCARQALRDAGTTINVELVACPAITLVDLVQEDNTLVGMQNRFFQVTPWDSTPYTPSGSPQVAVLALGINDEFQGVTPDTFFKQQRDFIAKLLEIYPSLKHVWLIVPIRDEGAPDLVAYRNKMDSGEVEWPTSVPSVDFKVIDLDGDAKISTLDGLHPSVEGHLLLGEKLAQLLREHGPTSGR